MHEKQTPAIAQKKVRITAQDNNQKPTPEESISGTAPGSVSITKKPAGVDPLSGLPPINISGYVHNEQNGNLAMINNKLVHEGEEIYPGLLLIKILDNSAIFSYKGYIFTR
jgi:general secretion pathway protein B